MSPIAIGLDLLLVAMLGVALVLGLRLNKKLQAVRDSGAAFTAASVELNAAAARAEAGLKAIRVAGDEVHDSLLARIETARGLAARLEAAAAEATRAADKVAALPPPRLAPEASPRLAAAERAAERLAALVAERELAAQKTHLPVVEPVRLRPRLADDDLFEAPARAGSLRR